MTQEGSLQSCIQVPRGVRPRAVGAVTAGVSRCAHVHAYMLVHTCAPMRVRMQTHILRLETGLPAYFFQLQLQKLRKIR